jgi:predicted DNA-binding protein with PD1-like motif
MKSKLLSTSGPRSFLLVFEQGEEVHDGVLRFAEQHRILGAEVRAISALQNVVFAFFDRTSKKYVETAVREQVEVVGLSGNIAWKDARPKLHAHIVVTKRDGTAQGGHLIKGEVWPTLEMFINETPAGLQRTQDEETGLALLDL